MLLQFPQTFRCTEETLRRIDGLGRFLKDKHGDGKEHQTHCHHLTENNRDGTTCLHHHAQSHTCSRRSSHSRQRLSGVRPVLVGGRFAVEFREPGWFKPEVYDVLQRWDLCLCAIHVAMPR